MTGGLSVHPAVLDACLQVSMACTEPGNEEAYVPFELARLDLLEAVPSHLYCYARLRETKLDNRETLTADLWLLDETERLLGQVLGLVVKRATPQAMLKDAKVNVEDWLYEVQWQERPRTMPSCADFLPAVPPLTAEVQALTAGLLQEAELEGTDLGQGASQEELSRQYIAQAFRQLGWSAEVGTVFDSESLSSRLGILPSHGKLTERMLQVLSEGDLLQSEGSRWRVVGELPAEDPQELQQQLLARYPHARIELTLLARCGTQLSGVLTGQVDPLGLLFPREGLRAEELYRDAPVAQVFNALVRESLRRAVSTLPGDRPLRVLEIGAGTGGTTSYVLPVLPADRTQYDYTDLSAGFFDAAEQQFGGFPFIKYRVLDIEREPSEQGFQRHHYDIILASNVLHATRNLEETLAHVRQLLAPQGLLVLLEGLQRQAWVDLIFGLLEGWWRFDDPLRPDYALMDLEQWSGLLRSQGFEEPHALSVPELSRQAVILSRGPADVELQTPGSWLIFADREGLAEGLAERLARQQQTCVLVEPGANYVALSSGRYQIPVEDSDSWERLLAETLPAELPLQGVVHLWSVDATDTGLTTPETLAQDTHLSCGSVLSLVQALVRKDRLPGKGLWLVSRGAQVTQQEQAGSLAQSPLWGMAKGIALEHPELSCRLIDLDAAHPQGQLEPLSAELLAPESEDQVALRETQRWVPRLVRRKSSKPKKMLLRSEGTYLITGGSGASDWKWPVGWQAGEHRHRALRSA